jgi:cytochrome c oxidase subunit 4
MAQHTSYEEQKQFVVKGLILLGIITLVEVFIALWAKGHLFGAKWEGPLHYVYMFAMVGASIYKAYFIVFHFMHMAHEVRGLALSVLLPMSLLIWALIAFFQEGTSWGARREQIREFNEEVVQPAPSGAKQGYLLVPDYSPLRG